jgi:hypothetical protein
VSRSSIAYDVFLKVGIVFAFTELGNNPGEYFEVILAPVAFDAFVLDHSSYYHGYFSILVSIFLNSASGRIQFSMLFYGFFCMPQ